MGCIMITLPAGAGERLDFAVTTVVDRFGNHPCKSSVGQIVFEVVVVVAGQHLQAAVLFGRFVDIDQNGHQIVVCMRVVSQVLMPFHHRANTGRLEVELAQIDADMGPNQVLQAVEQALVSSDATKTFIDFKRIKDAARSWRFAILLRLEFHDAIGLTAGNRLVGDPLYHLINITQRRFVEKRVEYQITFTAVVFDLGRS